MSHLVRESRCDTTAKLHDLVLEELIRLLTIQIDLHVKRLALEEIDIFGQFDSPIAVCEHTLILTFQC